LPPGAFLSRFYEFEPALADPAAARRVERLLPRVCLRRLDAMLEKRASQGYPKLGGGCGPGDALRAARCAMALVRWVVAAVQLVLLWSRREQLDGVAAQIRRTLRAARLEQLSGEAGAETTTAGVAASAQFM
jgi:hypothetical protein